MSNKFLMQMQPWFGQEERDALNEYMSGDVFLTEFKKTWEFEKALAGFTKARSCIAVNNGTVSLSVAALALGICASDEVIVPNYTMIASANAFRMLGCEIKFCDVEKESLCIDINNLKKIISSKTKAVVLVSANGRFPSYPFEELKALCEKYGVYIIEDAAQSLGSFYEDGTHIGLKGDIGSLSFSPPKIISTGQGGALITNDEILGAKVAKLKDFGRTSGGNDIHDVIGFNFKFTDLQAVIGLCQLEKLNWRLDRKKEIYSQYNNFLPIYPGLELIKNRTQFTAPWFFEIIAPKRSGLKKFLFESGIGTREMYPPINAQKAFNSPGRFPNSEFIGKNGLWLPSQSQLSNAEIEFVCHKIKEFYTK